MAWSRFVLFAFLAGGCARGTSLAADDIGDDDDDIDARVTTVDAAIDAPGNPPIDARVDAPGNPPIDAPPTGGSITLSQTTTAVGGNVPACFDDFGNFETSYYRLFVLSDFGVTTTFSANRIDFGIGQAFAGDLISQPVEVRIYRTAGSAIILPSLIQIGSAVVNVPDGATNTVLQVPISGVAPAGSSIVAEIFVPDGFLTGDLIAPGSSSGAQTAEGFVRALDCDIPDPASFLSIGFPDAHLVLSVTGTF